MYTDFPTNNSKFLKTDNFQDREVLLTYRGWKKKANEDDPVDKKNRKTWKEKLKYILRYSYPEWAIDTTTGEKMLGKDGQPFQNRYYDPMFPQGYSIIYVFDEGELETGSKPLFEAFCAARPKPGERLLIHKTGKDKETVWTVSRPGALKNVHPQELPEVNIDDSPELKPDEDLPF